MDFSSQQLIALKQYLKNFSTKTLYRAFDYTNPHAVHSILYSGQTLEAKVNDTEKNPYSVSLYFNERSKSWEGDCTCPSGMFCKHNAALVSFLLKTGMTHVTHRSDTFPEPLPAENREFIAFQHLEKEWKSRGGQTLNRKAKAILRHISSLYLQWIDGADHLTPDRIQSLFKLNPDFGKEDCAELSLVLPVPGAGAAIGEADPLAFWHLLIDTAGDLGWEPHLPADLMPLCQPGESRAFIQLIREEQSRHFWNDWLDHFSREDHSTRPPCASIRLMVDREKCHLECDELGMGNYRRMTLRQRFALLNGDLPLPSAQRQLLSELDTGTHDQIRFSLSSEEGKNTLRRILTRKHLQPFIHRKNHSGPLVFPQEKLTWHLENTGGKDRFTLRSSEKELRLLPLQILEGRPGVVLIEDRVYQVNFIPRHWGLNLEKSGCVEIPRGALLSSGGVKLARLLEVELEDEYETSIFRRTWQVHVYAEIQSSRDEDLICLSLQAHSEFKSDPILSFTRREWEQPPAPDEKNRVIEEIWQGSADARILMESLEPFWNPESECFQIESTRKNITTLAEWNLIRTEAQFHARGELEAVMRPKAKASLSISLKSKGTDWFDVETRMDTGEEKFTNEELALLVKSSGQWVRLPQKGWRCVELPDEEKILTQLSDLGMSPDKDSILPTRTKTRLHVLQLVHAAENGSLDEQNSRHIHSRLDSLTTQIRVTQPPAIHADMRPYQKEGFQFLAYLSTNQFGGILADDMGLGKTLQTLVWLAYLHEQKTELDLPSLVICPKSVMSNWVTEANRFYPGLKVHVVSSATSGHAIRKIKAPSLVVMNYAQMRVRRALMNQMTWLAAILDEGQFIKNPGSQTARAAFALKARHRLVLTGTPVENRLMDLWSLMRFAMPSALGTESSFKHLSSDRGDGLAHKRVGIRLKPFFLRRTKKAVASELPERIEEDVTCELEGHQKTLYEAELKKARQILKGLSNPADFNEARFNILASLMKLRQICCHPALLKVPKAGNTPAKQPSAKLDALDDLLDPLRRENEKVLIFSQFTSFLDIIEPHLLTRDTPVFKLTGKTNKREQIINSFRQARGHAVFLISLKAGGSGLNLTEASYVVMMDPWWNPAVENQAIDRAHRIGQRKTVIAYRMLVKNTLEEKIRHLQKHKKSLADQVLGEAMQQEGRLSMEDFQFLLE